MQLKIEFYEKADGTQPARELYFFYVGEKAILTNGFIKKTTKTPSAEIQLAKKYRDDYKKD